MHFFEFLGHFFFKLKNQFFFLLFTYVLCMKLLFWVCITWIYGSNTRSMHICAIIIFSLLFLVKIIINNMDFLHFTFLNYVE